MADSSAGAAEAPQAEQQGLGFPSMLKMPQPLLVLVLLSPLFVDELSQPGPLDTAARA